MIQSTQKIIKVGSSAAVTIPAKEFKRQNLSFGDEVVVTISPVGNVSLSDQEVINSAKEVLSEYKKDFQNLAER